MGAADRGGCLKYDVLTCEICRCQSVLGGASSIQGCGEAEQKAFIDE